MTPIEALESIDTWLFSESTDSPVTEELTLVCGCRPVVHGHHADDCPVTILRKVLQDFERLKEAAANFLASRDIAATVKSARNQDMAFGDEIPDYREDCERIVKVADALDLALKESEDNDD